jgi:hypothetical protein
MAEAGSPAVWLAVSGHGFGHAAQVCAVARALRELAPQSRLVVQSGAPRDFFANRLTGGFEYLDGQLDPGIPMRDSVSVDRRATREAYLVYHADWQDRLKGQMRLLEASAPDVLLADIPYVSLAAAKGLSIPALALCSLNWADILDGYFPGDADIAPILDTMRACYQGADAFLAPDPSMPMSWLHNRVAIAPLALLGRNRRQELLDSLGLAEPAKIVVLAFGGFDLDVSAAHLPAADGLHWLTQGEASPGRTDVTPLKRLPLPFPDILASADALVTKPGYGVFAEAACLGLPVVTVERPDWPETPFLVSWLKRQVPAAVLTRSHLQAGCLLSTLTSLWQERRPPEVTPSGADEAARWVLAASSQAR